MQYRLIPFFFLLAQLYLHAQDQPHRIFPEGFDYIEDSIPNIVTELRYSTNHNFIGQPITGYNANRAILSRKAIHQLQQVQKELHKKGLGLKIFDAYRPQRAVNHFVTWARTIDDTLTKSEFYPHVNKKDLFNEGYIASRSGHSRGSTIDITIIDLFTGQELDMGSSFDYFGEKSHHNYSGINRQQKRNRKQLRKVMEKYGFRAYEKEWWHYPLKNEPFPDTYFDFPIQ